MKFINSVVEWLYTQGDAEGYHSLHSMEELVPLSEIEEAKLLLEIQMMEYEEDYRRGLFNIQEDLDYIYN